MEILRWTGTASAEEFDASVKKQSFWYHSYYFDSGLSVRGDYNIGANIAEYGLPDLTGVRVLDIGTGGGWFAFWFEQQGADVTTVDARGYCDFDVFGRPDYLPVETEKPEPDRIAPDGTPIYHSPVSGGFWIMRDLLGSDVKFVNARIYELRPELFAEEAFDLVFLGAVLPHVRDPVGALQAARRVCSGRLIATMHVVADGSAMPSMALPYVGVDPITWWLPNEACFRDWFLAAGFASVDIEREVTVSSDAEHPSAGNPSVPRNPTQVLRVGDARV